jgi:hypothetical protein
MHLPGQTDLALGHAVSSALAALFLAWQGFARDPVIRRRQLLDSDVRLLTQAAAHRLLATISGTDSRRSIFRSRLNIA